MRVLECQLTFWPFLSHQVTLKKNSVNIFFDNLKSWIKFTLFLTFLINFATKLAKVAQPLRHCYDVIYHQ